MDPIFFHHDPQISGDAEQRQALRIAVQPNMSVKDWPTEAGSTALAGFNALEDATIVTRLRQAGYGICGSTRMSEFGLGTVGSQAGVAVAQDAVDVELVLDLMGESRLAASRSKLCCLKPSYGLVSRLGLIGLIPSMECCGLLAKSLDPIRAVLQATAGPDDLDFSLPAEDTPDLSPSALEPAETTIGFIREMQAALPEAETEAFRASLGALERRGFSLAECSLPDLDLFSLVHRIVGSVEASSAAGRYDSVRYGPRAPGAKNWNEMYLLSRGAAFGTLVKSYLIQGAFFQFERYDAFEDACRIRARLVQQMQNVTAEVGFLAFPAPVAPSAAVDGAGSTVAGSEGADERPDDHSRTRSLTDLYAEAATTLFANVTGQPVLYLPPTTDTGETGLQLTGPRRSDGRLLDLGELILRTSQGGGR